MRNPAVEPVHVSVSKSKGLRIDWGDGSSSEFELRYLRDHCPCASCTGAHGTPSPAEQQGSADPNPFTLYQPALKIEGVDPVGNYAIKIRWNDGHDTGIYTWEYLRGITP